MPPAIAIGYGIAETSPIWGPPLVSAATWIGGGILLAVGLSGDTPNADTQATAQTQATTATCQTGNCEPPPECQDAIAKMRKNLALLKKELAKYDPVADAVGGFPMGGGKLTSPGGHYKEIRDLQRGLKNAGETYQKNKCYDKVSKSDKVARDHADAMANQNIEIPPGQNFIPLR
ncbi:hypothetical protein K6M90_08915 [Rhizobium sp. 9T]|jgi:hypothetical protein|uniref:hypothetical protein n=1 Tax=Rhizobium TaxID=379 RepID=UPI001C9322B4|nr:MULTISPECIES: hypothetical protein [Rhizobium]MBY4607773.1 hypothetical protein [Rhizobium croatiense]ULR42946.1 hypothetical protein MHI61_16990 [Rhizobium sp. K102]